MLHTNECTKRFINAEKLSKIALSPFTDCPRCNLNNAAPGLLAVCKLGLVTMTAQFDSLDAINKGVASKAGLEPLETPFPPVDLLKAAIAKAEKGA